MMMSEEVSFPQLLKIERDRKHLSQQQLADMAGISRSEVKALESGTRDARLAAAWTFFKLAEALKISVTKLHEAAGLAEPQYDVLYLSSVLTEEEKRAVKNLARSYEEDYFVKNTATVRKVARKVQQFTR